MKGMAAAILLVKNTAEKMIKLKFDFDLTNLVSPSDNLTIKPNKTSYLVLKPKVLGEQIGLGLQFTYELID
jgi:hypothetical protein